MLFIFRQPGITGPKNEQSQAKPNATESKSELIAAKTKSIQDDIHPIDFHGKKISCLFKSETKQQFALIEAISRVYFPKCSLQEFIDAITNVLQISIYELNSAEEKAFIAFYGLPTKSLKCSKVLDLNDIELFMPQMEYMFKSDECSPVKSKNASPTDNCKTAGVVHRSVAGNNPDFNHNGASQSHINTNTIDDIPMSCPFNKDALRPKAGALAKMTNKLESAVNRLRQNKEQDNNDISENMMGPHCSSKLSTGGVVMGEKKATNS